MSDLRILHRAFAGNRDDTSTSHWKTHSPDFQVWETCQRQIVFVTQNSQRIESYPDQSSMELYEGYDAEAFLAEVLCGLKSPLVGETEVFGQFRNWWKSLPDKNFFKMKFQGRMDTLFALVKVVREKALCGHGSQSYGSLLRKQLSPDDEIEIVGAGHLVQEILPWLEKSPYRIWCRSPEKVRGLWPEARILPLDQQTPMGTTVLVAAPLSHEDLNQWLEKRGFSAQHKIFDYRANSRDFQPFVRPKLHLKLQDFSSEFDVHQIEIQRKADMARQLIQNWKDLQMSRSLVRPYGWEDL